MAFDSNNTAKELSLVHSTIDPIRDASALRSLVEEWKARLGELESALNPGDRDPRDLVEILNIAREFTPMRVRQLEEQLRERTAVLSRLESELQGLRRRQEDESRSALAQQTDQHNRQAELESTISELRSHLAGIEQSRADSNVEHSTLRLTVEEQEQALTALRDDHVRERERRIALESLSRELESQYHRQSIELSELKASLISQEQLRGSLTADLERRQKDVEWLQGKLSESESGLEDARANVSQLQVELEAAQEQTIELQATLTTALYAKQKLQIAVDDSAQTLAASHTAGNELQRELAELRLTCEDLQNSSRQAAARSADLESMHSSAHLREVGLREESEALKRSLEAAERALQESNETLEAERTSQLRASTESSRAIRQLTTRLAVEQGARKELESLAVLASDRIAALETANARASLVEHQLLSSVGVLQRKLDAALGESEVLEQECSTLRSLQERLMTDFAAARDDIATLERDWTSLYVELEETQRKLAQTENRLEFALSEAQREDEAAARLKQELDQARNEAQLVRDILNEAQGALVETRANADSRSAQVAIARVRAAQLEEQIVELESELDSIRRAAVADRAVMQDFVADVRSRNEILSADLRSRSEALDEKDRELRELHRRAMQSVDEAVKQIAETERRLGGENQELRARVAEAENALAVQTDSFITTMQAENAQLSQLVDVVQSSRFWKFKRWLNRLRGKMAGV